jgi:ABC-type uncharacterized transport system substrate-binding protein
MSNEWGTCMARNVGRLLTFLAVVLAGTAFLPSPSQGAPSKQVLVIHSYHIGYKWTDEMTQGITAALRDEGKAVQVRYEYMDTKRVSDPAYFELLYETYKYKYRTARFDVIIATDNDAFDFLKQYRDPLFPATPVVFCGVNYFGPSQLEGKKLFTGVNEAADIKATLDLALRLHPATRQIVVINDTTTTGRIVHREVERLIPAYHGRVRFLFLEELEMQEILKTVQKLGPDSLVFFGVFFRDKAGRFYEYDEGISLIAESCPVPVYGVWDFYLGYGLTGGMLTSGYLQGETAGRIALLILRGEKVEDIPVVMKKPEPLYVRLPAVAAFSHRYVHLAGREHRHQPAELPVSRAAAGFLGSGRRLGRFCPDYFVPALYHGDPAAGGTRTARSRGKVPDRSRQYLQLGILAGP